jgi:5'-methylthioadenosine phosphorylase
MVIEIMRQNARKAQNLIGKLTEDFPSVHESCPIGSDRALYHAIVTQPSARDPALIRKLEAVAGRVLSSNPV